MSPLLTIVFYVTTALTSSARVYGDHGSLELPQVATNSSNTLGMVENGPTDTELMLAFVMFRHGDRTPDQEEIDLYPTSEANTDNIFFPYGKKALTNKGKQRGYNVGVSLRKRYDGFISKLYLANEILIRTTDYARTKMTALTALAALYPPLPAQQWNPALNWQPIPYNTPPFEEDDILYYYNCPKYLQLRDRVYEQPEIKKTLEPYQKIFKYCSIKTGLNITTPEQVFFLDNLFQTLNNVGLKTPQWAVDIMTKIQEVTKLEFAIEYYTPELRKLASGPLLIDIYNYTKAAINSNLDQPRIRLYSAHENNIAGFMAATNTFYPHQPKYGATFALELRRHRATGQYGIMAVYNVDAGGHFKILPIKGCGNKTLCPYETFVKITQENSLAFDEFKKQCHID